MPLIERALFVGVQGKPLNDTQLGQVFRHYVASSGIGERKRVTPHRLRSATPPRDRTEVA
ncbi:MAG: hypothetical protein MSC30_13355 [Gaiellaceae bacterium MAG52_C11]|nr:hypothetical protein [Candidatus Gaiellasilicea maunaloa]